MTVTNSIGCIGKDTVVVTAINVPPPTITQSGVILTSSISTGYRWYNNNIQIPNATNQTYTATSNGTYTVRAISNGCLSVNSNSISVVITAVSDPVLDRQVRMTPNPVQDKLYINCPPGNSMFELSLFDISGIKLFSNTAFRNSLEVDMKTYAAGTYIVRMIDKHSGKQIQRVIVKL